MAVGLEAIGFDANLPTSDKSRFYSNMADLDPYGNLFDPASFTMRNWDSIHAGAEAGFNSYDTSSITQADAKNLEDLADTLHEWRPFLGKRLFEGNEVTQIFHDALNNNFEGQNKAIGLYLTYNAKYGGLKDPNGPISFENLKDPGLLIKQSRGLTSFFNGERTTEAIHTLTDMALKAQNPHLAALLLKQAGHGWGKDDAQIQKILVDSRENMSEGQYARFISDTSRAFEKLNGERLSDFINRKYSSIGIETTIAPPNSEGQAIISKINASQMRDNRTNDGMMELMYV